MSDALKISEEVRDSLIETLPKVFAHKRIEVLIISFSGILAVRATLNDNLHVQHCIVDTDGRGSASIAYQMALDLARYAIHEAMSV
jgi:hypothetical protein